MISRCSSPILFQFQQILICRQLNSNGFSTDNKSCFIPFFDIIRNFLENDYCRRTPELENLISTAAAIRLTIMAYHFLSIQPQSRGDTENSSSFQNFYGCSRNSIYKIVVTNEMTKIINRYSRFKWRNQNGILHHHIVPMKNGKFD